jgi:gluconate 5-dehydrogenase
MADLFDFSGKVAMVVGVGGIGSAQAIAFAEHGADIVVADNRSETAEKVAEEAKAMGRKALDVTVDVTQETSVAAMVSRALEEFPRIDILVNTAGYVVRRKSSDDYPLDEWQKVIDVNLRGTWLCCQAVGRVMLKQGGGRIINMSSVAGSYGARGGGVSYGPSKAAVNLLTRTLAYEWAKSNILVNALAPTVVETEFTKEVLEKPELAEALKNNIPMGRWAMPEDVVGPTLFFASEASNYVTGQVLFVDGGLTTKVQ